MIEKIEKEFKEALKNKDKCKISTLRMLRSAIKNKEIEKRPEEIDESDVKGIIFKLAKQHKDSIRQFKKGDRDDLADKEQEELNILQKFLPKQLSEEEIKEEVKKIINQVNATGMQDMGKVMGKIMKDFKGQVDGKLVNKITSKFLSSQE